MANGRRNALSIFEKGTRAFKLAKKALKDSKLSKKEFKKIVRKGDITKRQAAQFTKAVKKGEGLKVGKFAGDKKVGKAAKGLYSKMAGKQRAAALAQEQETDDSLSDIRKTIQKGEDDLVTILGGDDDGGGLTDIFAGQLDQLITGQQDFREDLKTMFANMMALGGGREGALGVRSARRKPLGQAGTTGQFGREGLRIRSINI